MHHAGYSGALNEVDASVCKIMKNEIDDKLKWKQFYTINQLVGKESLNERTKL